MKQSIPEKIKLLTDLKNPNQIYKIFPSLMVVSYEDLEENINILRSIGITLKHTYEVKVCLLKPSELKRRIDIIKEGHYLSKYVKDPILILDSRAFTFGFEIPEVPKDEPNMVDYVSLFNQNKEEK
jgi:hypothetical protein